MYVVHVVQSGAGLGAVCQKARTGSTSSRAVCADASNASVVPLHEVPQAAAAPPASRTSKTTVPLLRQIAVLMRTPEHQQRLPAVVATRCSAQDSCSVLTATTTTYTTPTANTNNSVWGEGPDPLVIHLPSADGTSESSPADPASGGLPSTPRVVSDSHSLALRDHPSAVQRRQPPAVELRFIRPGSSSSRTLPTIMQQRGPNTLQARTAAAAPAPAPRTEGSLQPKAPNPLGFLPALQWGSNSTHWWGSPIGGTLFVNPPVDQPNNGQQASASAAGTSPAAAAAAAAQRSGQQQRMYWGSPIGGTLFINPSVDEVHDTGRDAPAARMGADAAAGRAAATVAGAAVGAASASSSYGTLPGMSKQASKSSRLPFLPPFQWGSPSSMQWGSPIGGTLYINPQAPAADWSEGPWGHGGSGFGSSSGGGGGSSSSAPGSGSSGSGSSKGGGASNIGSVGGIASKQPGGMYASARAAQASWGGVPPGVGLVKLGVGLTAAMAAVMLTVYLKSTPTAGSNSGSSASVQACAAAPAAAGAGGAVGAASAAPGASAVPAESGAEGVGFHQWMVQRLQSTLDGFEAEASLLTTELSVLNSMPAAGGANRQGVLGGLKSWLGGSSSSSSSSKELSEAAAAAAAVSGGVTARVVGSMSPADAAARVSEIQEQLESLDVLKSALGVELAEQQEQLKKAQSEVQSAQDQLAALSRR